MNENAARIKLDTQGSKLPDAEIGLLALDRTISDMRAEKPRTVHGAFALKARIAEAERMRAQVKGQVDIVRDQATKIAQTGLAQSLDGLVPPNHRDRDGLIATATAMIARAKTPAEVAEVKDMVDDSVKEDFKNRKFEHELDKFALAKSKLAKDAAGDKNETTESVAKRMHAEAADEDVGFLPENYTVEQLLAVLALPGNSEWPPSPGMRKEIREYLVGGQGPKAATGEDGLRHDDPILGASKKPPSDKYPEKGVLLEDIPRAGESDDQRQARLSRSAPVGMKFIHQAGSRGPSGSGEPLDEVSAARFQSYVEAFGLPNDEESVRMFQSFVKAFEAKVAEIKEKTRRPVTEEQETMLWKSMEAKTGGRAPQ